MANILFIEDDPLTLELMGRAANLLGHSAMLTSNGVEAVHAVARTCPNLILIDLNLPGEDGIEVMGLLRKQSLPCQPPIYLITAGFLPQIKEKALYAGAQGCLEKPLSLVVLAQLIKENSEN